MAFVIKDEYLPATLTTHSMSDSEFTEICDEHPDLFFEMTAEGELIVKAPTDWLTGVRNGEIFGELRSWAKKDGRGTCVDSSTGFVLPNGARRSPDASWTLKSRLTKDGFQHLCPDFVIELKSDNDRLRTLDKKMEEYMDNGAQLGWLIDPEKRTVAIYRPGREVETLTGPDKVAGEGPVTGFVLDLSEVWDPLA